MSLGGEYPTVFERNNVTNPDSDRIYKVANLFDPEGPNRRRIENGRATAKRRAGPQAIDDTTGEDDAPFETDAIDPESIDPLIMAVSDAPMSVLPEVPVAFMECSSSDHYPPSAHTP